MNVVLHGCKVARVLHYVVRYDVCVTIDTIDYVTGIGNSNVIASDDRFAGSEI